MQLFSEDAIEFKKKISFFLSTKCWKKHPQKLLRKTQIHLIKSLTAWAAKRAQTEEFKFQNVA